MQILTAASVVSDLAPKNCVTPQSIFEGGTFGGILLMRFLISLLSNDLFIDMNPLARAD
jgi:hypothetical protein